MSEDREVLRQFEINRRTEEAGEAALRKHTQHHEPPRDHATVYAQPGTSLYCQGCAELVARLQF